MLMPGPTAINPTYEQGVIIYRVAIACDMLSSGYRSEGGLRGISGLTLTHTDALALVQVNHTHTHRLAATGGEGGVVERGGVGGRGRKEGHSDRGGQKKKGK